MSHIDEQNGQDRFARCWLIVPAYDPLAVLERLVADLRAEGFPHIVVIDDGSEPDSAAIFAACAAHGATVLRHPRNRGKGAALKTGFDHALAYEAEIVITLDADGQHLVRDVRKVANAALRQPGTIVLGGRQFSGDVPLRSRLGNGLTRWLFGKLSGLPLGDTQTGLRAFPSVLLPELAALPGERYEYETNVLIAIARLKHPVVEVPIATVYLDGNSASHFRPVLDSIRIYFVLLRDILLALSSFAFDIVLFNIALHLTDDVIVATFAARGLSGIYNFVGNKYFVFRQSGSGRLGWELTKYVVLAIALASLSGQIVNALYPDWIENATVCKVMVDLTLYAASFLLRRFVVFRQRL